MINLDKVLNLVHKIRLLCPNKTIWLYTGYEFESIFRCFYKGEYVGYPHYDKSYPDKNTSKRLKILRQCNIVVDGKYIEELKDISLRWRGSSNQRVIDVQRTLKEGTIILWN